MSDVMGNEKMFLEDNGDFRIGKGRDERFTHSDQLDMNLPDVGHMGHSIMVMKSGAYLCFDTGRVG
jgi:hypothetical protein